MKKGQSEIHTEMRSSRREPNSPPSALSAPPREKKSGWQTKTFDEVLEIRNGRNQHEVESAGGEFPIYGSGGNVMGMATDYICEAGTTIIGRKGNINSPIYADTRFWNVDTAFGLAAKAGMDSKFLYFFCLSYDFSAHNRGTTIPSLVKSELLNISIPVPPLAEQQRIVGLLDEAFEGLATARANAEKNLQNARALFESHLQSVFTQRGPGWVEKKVSEIAKHSLGKMLDKAKNKGEPQPYLRNINVRWFTFDLSDLLQMPFLLTEAEKYTAIKGDVLICEGGYPGRAAIWDEDYPIYFQKALHRVRFHQPELNKWFVYYLSVQDSSGQLQQHFSGTGIQHFTGEVLARFTIPVPPLPELRRAVARFDALSEETQRLARLYERKLAALEALKKSLLHQAFTGEL
jgi:type I restriction enzyme S subunit